MNTKNKQSKNSDDTLIFLFGMIESVVGLAKTFVVLLLIIVAGAAYLRGFDYMLELSHESVKFTLANIFMVAVVLELLWPFVKKALLPAWYASGASGIAAHGISITDYNLTEGRRIVDEESKEKKCIPWEKDKQLLEALGDQLAVLTTPSEFHDKKLEKLLQLNTLLPVTADIDNAKKLINYRYGNVKSNLQWDIDLNKQDDDVWVCTLKVRRENEEEYKPVERTMAKYAPVAIVLAVIRRESRLWLSRT